MFTSEYDIDKLHEYTRLHKRFTPPCRDHSAVDKVLSHKGEPPTQLFVCTVNGMPLMSVFSDTITDPTTSAVYTTNYFILRNCIVDAYFKKHGFEAKNISMKLNNWVFEKCNTNIAVILPARQTPMKTILKTNGFNELTVHPMLYDPISETAKLEPPGTQPSIINDGVDHYLVFLHFLCAKKLWNPEDPKFVQEEYGMSSDIVSNLALEGNKQLYNGNFFKLISQANVYIQENEYHEMILHFKRIK